MDWEVEPQFIITRCNILKIVDLRSMLISFHREKVLWHKEKRSPQALPHLLRFRTGCQLVVDFGLSPNKKTDHNNSASIEKEITRGRFLSHQQITNSKTNLRRQVKRLLSIGIYRLSGFEIGTEKLESCNIRERDLRAEKNLQMLAELKRGEEIKVKRIDGVHRPALQNVYLSSELKCSLCKSYFKDSVMIPCCQHRFCQKCIRQTLIQKGTCPKCTSKCTVADIIPNLSLTRVVKQFLESTFRSNDGSKLLHRDVSDGESGNGPKDQTSDIPKRQRELEMPFFNSAKQTGSNYIMRGYGGDNMHIPIRRHNKRNQASVMILLKRNKVQATLRTALLKDHKRKLKMIVISVAVIQFM